MKRANQQTSSAAVLSVGAELSRRGYDVTFTVGNTRKVDLLCAVPDGRTFKVQVKGLSNRNGFYIDKSFFEGVTQDDLTARWMTQSDTRSIAAAHITQ